MEGSEAVATGGATLVQTEQQVESHPGPESVSNGEMVTAPQPPPRPPRDVNPFGEPEIPPPGGEMPHGEHTEPPTPKSPPPPIPAASNGFVFGSEDADSSSSSSAGVGATTLSGPATSFRTAHSSPSPALVARRQAFDETRLFEEQRSNYFGERFENDSLYWKCFIELIRRSQSNNRRAITYAVQKLAAGTAYAKSLYAIRDRVDGLETGTTEARCEKERKQKGPKTWPPAPPRGQQQQQQQQHRRQESLSGSSWGGLPPSQSNSALESLFVMEEHAAMRFLDVCEEAGANVVQKRLRAMSKTLDDQFNDMLGQGTACLRLMHAAEANSAKAFSRYTAVVAESLKREEIAYGARPLVVSREASSSDVWLADMNYRVAVTQQGRVWRGASVKLGELFNKMKDIEVERRQTIQAGLTALVQLHDGLLRDLPILKDPVLQSLDRINLDRQLLDQEVRNEMRKGAARLRASRQDGGASAGCLGGAAAGNEAGAGNDGELAPASGEGGAPAQAGNGGASALSRSPSFIRDLESPLESKLIARSTMLERREKAMLVTRWVLVLAVLTHDSYLLLFDVPRNSAAYKKQLNARTAEAFAELVPKPEVESMAAELGRQKDAKMLESNGLPVPPSVAIDLNACKVVFKPDGKSDAAFEVTEIRPARGMKGVFKDYDESRYTLRGRSQEAMVDWVCQIKDMGRAGLQALAEAKH